MPESRPQVLLVEFESDQAERLGQSLPRHGFDLTIVMTSEDALAELRSRDFDAVVCRLHLDGLDGVGLAERIHANRSTPVIIITDDDQVEHAIAALRAGVYDMLLHPFSVETLALSLARAVRDRSIGEELERLRSEPQPRREDVSLIGESAPMTRIKDLVRRVSAADISVLVTGESGTGKELVARALHDLSPRASAPFVAINCSAVPAQLLESELFGHTKGAFTDAKTEKEGLFVRASGGTLFLDEIGDMPSEMQAKLLRALQESRVRPVGGSAEVGFDARVIAATNRDLEADIEEGSFREDLYYRLNVVHVSLPPLRARHNDVLLLAQFFLRHFAAKQGREVVGITAAAAERLVKHDWPGNVRELANCIERAVALTRFSEITVEDLPEKLRKYRVSAEAIEAAPELVSLEELERHHIRRVMEAVGGNKTRAAFTLGIDRRTLYRKLERYGIETDES